MNFFKLKSGVIINLEHIESLREDSGKRWRLSLASGREYVIDFQEAEMILNKVKMDGF